MNAADAVVESLVAGGVDVVFTLCGNHVLPLQEAMRSRGIRCVATRSEDAAVFAADAYGRVTRRAGVAVVTGGPGVSNTATALLTAKGNQSPVVLISGEPSTAVEGRGAQQDADHLLLTAGTTKRSVRVTRSDRVLDSLQEAFRIAEHGPTGPVHLSIPADVQSELLATPPAGVPPARRRSWTPAAPAEFVDEAAARVRQAARPVLIVGAGVWQHAGELAVAALASEHGIPVLSLDSARGIAPDSAACIMGSADAGLNPSARHIAAADCVVLAGRDADFRLAYGSPLRDAETVVHVHLDVASLGRNLPESALLCAGDPARFLTDLATRLAGHRAPAAWAETVGDEGDGEPGPPPAPDPDDPDGALHPASAADAIARVGVRTGAIFALDCGEFVQWCRARIPAEAPGHWLRLGPQATCGAGLPFGLGAQAARPDTPVIVVAGDGGIGYHIAELETAVRSGLGVVVVVGKDSAWGIERLLQTGVYGPDAAFTSDLLPTDFALVARGFGCDAVTVSEAHELEAALADAVEARAPRLIEVGIRTARSAGTKKMIEALRGQEG
jgi:acetolactate synthase-1/2/3 large subunit